jgi:hypothetical protein
MFCAEQVGCVYERHVVVETRSRPVVDAARSRPVIPAM